MRQIKSLSFLTMSVLVFGLVFHLYADVGPGEIDPSVLKRLDELSAQLAALDQLVKNQQDVIGQQASQIQALQSVIAEKKPVGTVYLPSKEEIDKKVNAGYGKITVNGLLQGWYSNLHEQNDSARIRRTELKFSGEIVEKLNWTIMFDPAQIREDTTRLSSLQDAFISLGYIPKHKLDIGQFKIPITEEGLRSSAKLDTIERSYMARNLGDRRDVGAMLTGDWDLLMYQLGVFNGEELNRLDVNDKKDLAWRTVLRPFRLSSLDELDANDYLKNLELGYSQYYRDANDTAAFTEKRRTGFEARWEYDRYSLKGEAAYGQTAASKIFGWYGQAGYFIVPQKLQGIFKLDYYEPNERAAVDRAGDLVWGLNYFLDSYHAKLQLNYIRRVGQDETADNQVIGALQVAF